MNPTDYILDSALVLLVLLQIRERPLTHKQVIRPLIILGIAISSYLHGIPTGGNDLVLIVSTALTGSVIGAASGATLIMRRGHDGLVLLRAGWLSAFFWVLGMGSRFAFIFWISHSGAASIARFSAHHAITGAEAWTVALLAMAAGEVLARTLVIVLRGRTLADQSDAYQLA
jgi:hypothetical protein